MELLYSFRFTFIYKNSIETNRNCIETHGCSEINSGDNINIINSTDEYKVNLYPYNDLQISFTYNYILRGGKKFFSSSVLSSEIFLSSELSSSEVSSKILFHHLSSYSFLY